MDRGQEGPKLPPGFLPIPKNNKEPYSGLPKPMGAKAENTRPTKGFWIGDEHITTEFRNGKNTRIYSCKAQDGRIFTVKVGDEVEVVDIDAIAETGSLYYTNHEKIVAELKRSHIGTTSASSGVKDAFQVIEGAWNRGLGDFFVNGPDEDENPIKTDLVEDVTMIGQKFPLIAVVNGVIMPITISDKDKGFFREEKAQQLSAELREVTVNEKAPKESTARKIFPVVRPFNALYTKDAGGNIDINFVSVDEVQK